jgi:hypothetical protein
MQRSIFRTILVLLVALFGSQASARDAVTGLRSGWQQTSIYASDFGVYPGSLTVDGNGNILIFDRGTKQLKQLASDGTISTLADLGGAISFGNPMAIGYQPGRDRVLITTDMSGLYAYRNGQVSQLKMFGIMVSAFAVDPRDDSFYGGFQLNGAAITHYDADGNSLGTVVASSGGPSQLVVDGTNGKLYYSETYAGRISVLDIASGSSSEAVSGLGIAGTSEPISVALDGQGTLHYFPAASGLYRYSGGQGALVSASIGGAGELAWSPTRNLFVQAQGAGANLIAYSIDGTPAYNLTPYVNAFAIGELADGRVIVQSADDNRLVAVTSSGFTAFGTAALGSCSDFAIDAAKRLFGTCGDTLLQVQTDGSTTTLVQHAGQNLLSLAYSSLTDEFVYVASADNGTGAATINRIAAGGGSSRTVTTLQNVSINNVLPALAVDGQDNIYILERGANKILRIAAGSSATTTWASNVLESEAITVPDIVYLPSENALLISTIENYQLWPLDGSARQTFASNNGAVDNFAMMVTGNGSVVAIHSGEVFRMSPAGASTTDPRIAQVVAWAEGQYPALFPGTAQQFETQGYQVWGYAAAGTYIGYKDGAFYYLGPDTAGQIVGVGTLEQLAVQAGL